jgi:hypothetical protein
LTGGIDRRVVRAAPGYADYQARVTRTLPVVALECSAPETGDDSRRATDLAEKLVEVHTSTGWDGD